MATIAFRSSSTLNYGSRASPTTFTAPSGIANDDILIAVIAAGSGSSGNNITPPAGFTAVTTATEANSGGFYVKLHVFWKRAASESGSYAFAHGGGLTTSTVGGVFVYSGCITSGNPVDVFSTNSGTGVTATALSVTTTAVNDMLVIATQNWDAAGSTPPTGFTERFDNLAILSDGRQVPIGASGNKTYDSGSAASPWQAWMIALKAQTVSSTEHLFNQGTEPSSPPAGAVDSAVTLGIYFTANVTANLTGLWFWKAANDTATARSVGLWGHSSGTLLASGSTSGEATGTARWVFVPFSTPYAATAGTSFDAGVHWPNGFWTSESGRYSGAAVVSPDGYLTAHGGTLNSYYTYGGSLARPVTISPTYTNYWVDPVIELAGGATNVTVTPSGQQMTAAVGSVTVVAKQNVTVIPSGQQATAAVGAVTVTARSNVTVTPSGQQATAAVGSVTVSTGTSVTAGVTGQQLTASVGSVTVLAKSNVTVGVTGQQATASVGSVTVSTGADITAAVTGQQLTAAVGAVTVATTSNITAAVTGQQMTAAVGAVTVAAASNITVPVSGVQATAAVGAVTVAIGAPGATTVQVTGLQMTAMVGSVTVVAAGGALPGGPLPMGPMGYPYARPRRRIIRHFFLEDEDEKPPKPTKKRIRELQQEVVAEAEGLLGRALPRRVGSELREEVAEAYTPRVTTEALEAHIDLLLETAVLQARLQLEEDDEEVILLALL